MAFTRIRGRGTKRGESSRSSRSKPPPRPRVSGTRYLLCNALLVHDFILTYQVQNIGRVVSGSTLCARSNRGRPLYAYCLHSFRARDKGGSSNNRATCVYTHTYIACLRASIFQQQKRSPCRSIEIVLSKRGRVVLGTTQVVALCVVVPLSPSSDDLAPAGKLPRKNGVAAEDYASSPPTANAAAAAAARRKLVS